MSLRALPILLTCLGGEMLYILQQRLDAHNIDSEKAKKVQQDIIAALFEESLFSDVLRPQELYTVTSMRRFCNRLAHSSDLRLSETGLSKLFDLMLMAVKYQSFCCTHPRELLFVVLNHLDAMKSLVDEKTHPDLAARLDAIATLMIGIYDSTSTSEHYLLRAAVLTFCQPHTTGVTNFIRDGIQSSYDGSFILNRPRPLPPLGELPGRIRYLDPKTGTPVREDSFVIDLDPGNRFPPVQYDSGPAAAGKRGTNLGTNLFSDVTHDPARPEVPTSDESNRTPTSDPEKKKPSTDREVHLLREMLIDRQRPTEGFYFDLFSEIQFESATDETAATPEVRKPPTVVARSAGRGQLDEVMQGFKVENERGGSGTNELGDDLLSMLGG